MKTRIGLATTVGLLLTTPLLASPDQPTDTPSKKKGTIKVTLADGTERKAPRKGIHLAASNKRGTPTTSPRQPDEVFFSIRDMDITEVLPMFEKQVGLKITYQGPVGKKVTLRLTQPVHWETALELVEAFTGTHLTRDYQGRLQLRSGYGGDLDEVKAEAAERRARRTVQASAKRFPALAPRRAAPKIKIGNPRPRRMGASNPQHTRVRPVSRVGPQRFGPRRVGPQRRAGPQRVGPQRVGPSRVGPQRIGPQRPPGPRVVGPRRVGPQRVGPQRAPGPRVVGPRQSRNSQRPMPVF